MNPLQIMDDKLWKEQGGHLAYPITERQADMPAFIPEVTNMPAVENTITPISKGTRDGYYDEVNDIDKNLRNRFVQ